MTKKHRYQELVDQIITDYCVKLSPGDLLPGLSELCEQYQTSEITIKKTMSLLAGYGFVKRIPGKGTVVQEAQALKNPTQVYIPLHKISILTQEKWSFSDYLEEQAVKYSKLNPEISFSIKRAPYSPRLDIEEYDLIAINEWDWANLPSNSLRPLESIHGLNFNQNSFFPEILKLCRRENILYILPLGFSPLVSIYNLNRPEISKIDWRNLVTFDQFTDAMKKVKNQHLKYPFYCMSMVPGVWSHFVHSYGGSIERLDRPEAQHGLQILYDMLHLHHICPVINDYTFHWNLFNTGRFIATWGKYGRIRANPHMKLGITPVPYGKMQNGSLYLEGLAVPKSTRKIPQIKDFINFLLGTDPQIELCNTTDGLSTQKIIAEFYLEKSKKHISGGKNLLKGLEYMRLVPDTPKTSLFLRSIIESLQLLTLGVYEPAEFCQEVTKYLNKQKCEVK